MGELGSPEMVPLHIILPVRDASIEAGLREIPIALLADSLCKPTRAEIRVTVAKGFFGAVKEILAIKKCNSTFVLWLSSHEVSSKKITPSEAKGVSNGEQIKK